MLFRSLYPALRKAHVDTQRLSFLDAEGRLVASIAPESVTGGAVGLDLEVRRSDLASALYTPIADEVEFLFNDSISSLDERGNHVEVTFASGIRRDFDLVIGADGLHSNTRRLAFGPEEQFHRYLGYTFAGFTLPNEFGLAHEGVIWNEPGRAAVLYAHEPTDAVHGFLTFTQDEPPYDAFRDPQAQCELVAARFPEQSWHVPRLVEAMAESDDLFFDIVSQIRMPGWSRGRVALVGDAAYATSFLSGQGSSVALVGAYILAGELAAHADHAEAFAEYERKARPFVERNQALATSGSLSIAPKTKQDLEARNEALRNPGSSSTNADRGRAAHTALTLPDYDRGGDHDGDRDGDRAA